ncbi:uncharacterized protein MAM_00289 [Metarhizium album ARSEF 1941]|uniref:Uncharacterized protein n=1 Tax=Metarhizium album (strain ARSEF 1941) TaxID=1081103 RepID=A0A0B2X6C9_METAS|nr:uncharacterized protein MAM_00289 [Metarhizium album ARSEF 1941]KHO01288.1 hypothetical protein MAM_00289 [Metarhizium album ARSEF 1941]
MAARRNDGGGAPILDTAHRGDERAVKVLKVLKVPKIRRRARPNTTDLQVASAQVREYPGTLPRRARQPTGLRTLYTRKFESAKCLRARPPEPHGPPSPLPRQWQCSRLITSQRARLPIHVLHGRSIIS